MLSGSEGGTDSERARAARLLEEARAELRGLLRVRGAHRRTARRIARARLEIALVAAFLASPAAAEPRFLDPLRPYGLRHAGGENARPAFADLDGDGDLDAWVVDSGYGAHYFENTGSAAAPAFAPPVEPPYALTPGAGDGTLAFADLDDDGDLDAVSGTWFEQLSPRHFENTGAAGAPTFTAPVEGAFGLGPLERLANPHFGDLDGDGDLDALVTLHTAYTTTWLENTGSASSPAFLSPLHPFGLTGEVAFSAIGDLDGDGDLDVLREEGDGWRFAENTGTAAAPAFAAAVANPFGLPDLATNLELVDLDDDGDLDGYTANPRRFLENTGTANAPAFAAPLAAFGFPTDGRDPTFGDVDGDGDLDAFLRLYDPGDVLFAENTGSAAAPAFAAPVANPFGTVSDYAAPTPIPVDLDGDGRLDLVVANSPEIEFFRNTGTVNAPAFAAPVASPFGLTGVAQSSWGVRFADLDADGDPDMLSNVSNAGFAFHENVGSATAPAFDSRIAPFGLAAVRPYSIALGDLDGDGDLDAVAQPSENELVTLENSGGVATPSFIALPGSLYLPALFYGNPALADLDGDGDLDIVVGSYSAYTILIDNIGTPAAPSFRNPVNPFGLRPYAGYGTSLVDLDGDGDLDWFSTGYDNVTAYFAENTGSAAAPAFAEPVLEPFGVTGFGSSAIRPAFGDLDDDGDLDLLIGAASTWAYFENTGTATVPAFVSATPEWFDDLHVGRYPTLADHDGDGDLDLWSEWVDRNEIMLRENTGTAAAPAFAVPVRNPFGLVSVEDAQPSFADLDGDGDLDAFVSGDSGTVQGFENTGSATAPAFAPPIASPFALRGVNDPSAPAFGDLDGDGDLDALIAAYRHEIFYENLDVDGQCPAEPAPDCTEGFAKGALTIDERKDGKEKLAVLWSKGPPIAPEAFGDPLAPGGTGYAICLYDGAGKRVAALDVARAGASCDGKPCWKPQGGAGLRYTDKLGAADGVTSLVLKGGTKPASLSCAASNRAGKGRNALPTGIAAALAQSESVTVQLHAGEDACFSMTLDDVKKRTNVLFKAK